MVPTLLGRHFAIALELASAGRGGGALCCPGETLGLVSMWYEEPGKHPTPVNKSWYFSRRFSFVKGKGCGLPRTSYSLKHRFAVTLNSNVQFSFRRFKLCAVILPITASTSTISACLLTWGMGCWYRWRKPGMIPSLTFQFHHMLLTS